MTTGKLKMLTLATVGATALLLASAGGALAAKPKAKTKIQRVTAAVVLPADPADGDHVGLAGATATCPENTSVVGGGPLFSPGTPLPTNVELVRSGPFENGWSASWNNNTPLAHAVSVTAMCLRNRLKVTGVDGKATARSRISEAILPVQVPPTTVGGGVADFDVACPAGTSLVGGGALLNSVTPGIEGNLFESGARGNGWHVRIDNDETVAQPGTISAICIKPRLKLKGGPGKAKARSKVTTVTQDLALPPGNGANAGVVEATVRCPEGTTVASGGGVFAGPVPLTTSVELLESGPEGNGWHVRYNNDGVPPRPVTAQAICLRKKLAVK